MSPNDTQIELRSDKNNGGDGVTHTRMQTFDEFTQNEFSKPDVVTSLETFLNSKYGHPYLRFLKVEQKKECLKIQPSKVKYTKKELKELLAKLECMIKESLEDEPNNVKAGIAFDMETEASVKDTPEDLLCIQIVVGDVDDNDPMYTAGNSVPRKEFGPGDDWNAQYYGGRCDGSEQDLNAAIIIGQNATYNFHVDDPVGSYFFDNIELVQLRTGDADPSYYYGWGEESPQNTNLCDQLLNFRGWSISCCADEFNCQDCNPVNGYGRCPYYVSQGSGFPANFDSQIYYNVYCLESPEMNYYLTEAESVFESAALDIGKQPISVDMESNTLVSGGLYDNHNWSALLRIGSKRNLDEPVLCDDCFTTSTPICSK